MLKLFLLFSLLIFSGSTTSFYTFSLPAASGDSTISMSAYQGKKILVVNTASNSEYAPQYINLEQLYQRYKDSLMIIAVSSNSFGNEPESDSSIAAAILSTYNLSFPFTAKEVVTGDSATTMYKWLRDKQQNGVMNSKVGGDFQKYLIDASGNLMGVFAPEVDPLDDQITSTIEGR